MKSLALGIVAFSVAAAAQAASLLPPAWDPALAGDQVLERLAVVTAPQAKGAHDAEFVCVGDRAFIVEHDNDVQPGHGAGRHQYCVLSVVNLKTLAVERRIPLARSEQVFENETLPVGACFVPRILQANDNTLRCYFTSEDGNRREAQMWYRDFDLGTMRFESRIHQANLKTATGVFDMQPRHFHADAAAQGLTKPAQKFGLYIFDSFKEFDGQRYVAINNFPGKQNALTLLHDDLATFEIIGHLPRWQDVGAQVPLRKPGFLSIPDLPRAPRCDLVVRHTGLQRQHGPHPVRKTGGRGPVRAAGGQATQAAATTAPGRARRDVSRRETVNRSRVCDPGITGAWLAILAHEICPTPTSLPRG